MDYVNEYAIAGKVVAKDKETMTVKTVGMNFAADQEFDHEHEIITSNDDLKKIKKGSRVRILGKFVLDEKRHTKMKAVLVQPNYNGVDICHGKVVGKSHFTFRSLSPKPGKKELGNLLVNVASEGQTLVKVVLFQPTCTRFNIGCTTGSKVTAAGRIQHMEFDNRKTGKAEKMLEIVGADDLCEVLETAEIVDPMEAIKAEMTGSAI